MEELKLLLLEKGDSQKNLIDKVNFNFSQIVSFEGGPYGKIGSEGKTGNRGDVGPTGSFGYQGIRGNLWSLSVDSPSNPKGGDYWMNPDNNNEIRVYNSNTQNWDLYSLNINGLDIFRNFGPLQTSSGPSSKNGYFISLPYPLATTLVLSDSYLSPGSTTANPQYSKLVISTDSSNSQRRILEFTKGIYQGTSFSEQTPYFNWSSGSGSGTYGLNFISSGSLDFILSGGLSLRSLAGSITLKSGDFSYFSSVLNINSNGIFSSSSLYGNLNINVIDDGYGTSFFLPQAKNLLVSTSLPYISTSTVFDIRTVGTTGSQSSLTVRSDYSAIGNVYYKMDESYPSSRSGSTLFKANNNDTNILEISGKGDFKIDKSIYPLHPLENPGEYTFSVTIGFVTTNYAANVFSPTVSLNGQSGATGFNVSRGVDYYLIPPSGGDVNILSLWIPSTIGDGGWMDLIQDNEFMNFRIHSNNPLSGYTILSLNTTSSISSFNLIDTLGNNSVNLLGYCTSVEFTVINLSKTSSGTSPSDRWFKVLYQAYGPNLSPVCGELYTNGSTP
jgi:hypothetical protein